MDDLIKIGEKLGLPGLGMILIFLLFRVVFSATCDAIAWLGPNFLVQIREAVVASMGAFSNLVNETRTAIPVMTLTQEKVLISAEQGAKNIEQITKDQRDVKIMQKAFNKVMAQRCGVTDCPLLKSMHDSDDFDDHANSHGERR